MPSTVDSRARRGRPSPVLAGMAVAVGCLLSLAGCGGGSDGDGGAGVASLQSPSGGAGSASPSSGSSGPPGVQLRMDTAPAERNRIRNAWVRCLEKYGVQSYSKRDPDVLRSKGIEIEGPLPIYPEGDEKDHPEAYKKCESKRPLIPIALDPERNPNYADDFRTWVTCMNDRGLAVKATDSGPTAGGWTYTGGGSVKPGTPRATKIEKECKQKAFGG